MTLPAAIDGALCTGHGCWPSRPNTTKSPDVFINSKGALRVSDMYAVHCCSDLGCHPGSIAAGSSTVFINGKQAARKTDAVSCGSSILGPCSPDVFIGS